MFTIMIINKDMFGYLLTGSILLGTIILVFYINRKSCRIYVNGDDLIIKGLYFGEIATLKKSELEITKLREKRFLNILPLAYTYQIVFTYNDEIRKMTMESTSDVNPILKLMK